MSKAGTKKEALSNGDHVLNLSGFAYNKELMDQKRSQAEEYLVQRQRGTQKTTAKTFYRLCVE